MLKTEVEQSAPTPSPSNANVSTATLDYVLDIYFEQCMQNFINDIFNTWNKEGSDLNGSKKAFQYIYRIANYKEGDFAEHITKSYGKKEEMTTDQWKMCEYSLTICRHCNGDIDADELIYKQSEQLSALKDDQLKTHIGDYLKNNLNLFLELKSPMLYAQTKKSLEPKSENQRG